MNGDESTWCSVRAVLTTSQAIGAYGGFQFSHAFLEDAADHLNAGAVPMFVGHDQTKPLRVRGVSASVEPRTGEDGERRVGDQRALASVVETTGRTHD